MGEVGVDSFCGAVDGDGFFVVYEFGGVGCSEERKEVAEVGLCVLGFVGVCGVVCDELLWCHGWGCFLVVFGVKVGFFFESFFGGGSVRMFWVMGLRMPWAWRGWGRGCVRVGVARVGFGGG